MTKRSSLGAVSATAAAVLLFLGGAGWWYRTSRPEYRFRTGCEAARTGDFPRAVRQADALEESGQTDFSLLLHAEIEFRRLAPAQALGFLHRIKSQGDIQTQAAFLEARCLFDLHNPRAAENVLLIVLSQDPDHIDAHRYLAQIYFDQGDFRLALPQLKQVADLDPTNERPHIMMGWIYRDTDQYAEAAAAFQESLRRKPNGPKAEETRLELAEVQIKNIRHADALATLGDRDGDRAIALRTEAMVAVGDAAASVPLLDQALTKSPNHPGLLKQRADRYRDAGDNTEAAKLLERAVAADPNDFRVRTQLANCYTALGRSGEAADQQKKVDEIQAIVKKLNELGIKAMEDPWNPAIRLQLAGLCDQLNKPKLAKMWRDAAAACGSVRPSPPMGGR
jgi:tetratricopeptide (TPR) repeat protein